MRHTQLEKPAATPAQSKGSGLDRAQRPPAPIGNRTLRSLLSSERGIEGAAASLLPRLATLVGNQAFASFLRADAAPPVVNEVVKGDGQPLDHETRIDLEARFGQDFSTVRVHTDSEAARSAEALGARAYTVGHDIVFREGQYAPATARGRQTIAHELAHVIQQRRGGATPESRSGATHEQDADQAAAAVATGRPAVQVQGATAPGLAREADPETEAIEKALKETEGPGQQLQPSAPGQPAKVGPQKALTPEELIDEHVFTPRVSEEVGDLQRRLADRERALAANPGSQALKQEVESLRGRVRALTVVDPAGTGGNVPGHGNVNTRAAIQVVDGEGNLIALERGAWGPGRHAEVDALRKLDAQLGGRKLPPGARMDVAGNQVVCTDVCRPAVQEFAQKYGIRLEDVYTHVRTRPKIVGTGRASGKTTERTGLRSGMPQAEVSSEPLFGKGPGTPGPGTTGPAPKSGPSATEVHEGTATAPTTQSVTKPAPPAKAAPAKAAPAKAAPAKAAPAPSGKGLGAEHPSSGALTTAPPKAVKAPSTAPTAPAAPAHAEAPTHATPHAPTAAEKPAPAKPPPAKRTSSKPTASRSTASEPTASKPTRTTTSVDVPGPRTGGGRGGSRMTALTESAATGAAGAMLAQAMNQLTELAEQNPGDKDLAAAVDAMNKGMDAKSFVENPTQFIAEKVKAELIQGVFNHFSTSLNTARQSFEKKFPDVRTLHKDPLDTGVSLEDYHKNYDRALAALRVPDARKALLYVAVLIGLDENTPAEEIERRIALANRELAKLPGLGKYVERYNDARDRYSFALAAVINQLLVRGDEWAKQPAGLADELRRRGEALDHAAGVLYDVHQRLWESGAVAWVPVLAMAQDLKTLAQGFDGLGRQFREFADVVGRRKGEYDRELSRLQAEAARMAAQAVRAF